MKRKPTIGENIRIIRESLGFSQDYMASKLNITQQAYSNIEKNPEKITLKRLSDIATTLQVKLVTLLSEEDIYILQNFHQSGGNAATQMNIAPSTTEREIFNRLIEEQKEQILFLQSLLKGKK